MQCKYRNKIEFSRTKKYQTGSTSLPQDKNIDLTHIDSSNAKTMHPIFRNSYIKYYLIKSHVLNDPRDLQ